VGYILGRVVEVFASPKPKTPRVCALPHGSEKLGCRWGDRHKLVSPLYPSDIRKEMPMLQAIQKVIRDFRVVRKHFGLAPAIRNLLVTIHQSY
jgi:hypothetical protein